MNKIITVKENLFELGTLFSIFENQKDKFIQLMEMAKDLEPLLDDEKNEENKIYGCTSQAWVVVKKNKDMKNLDLCDIYLLQNLEINFD